MDTNRAVGRPWHLDIGLRVAVLLALALVISAVIPVISTWRILGIPVIQYRPRHIRSILLEPLERRPAAPRVVFPARITTITRSDSLPNTRGSADLGRIIAFGSIDLQELLRFRCTLLH